MYSAVRVQLKHAAGSPIGSNQPLGSGSVQNAVKRPSQGLHRRSPVRTVKRDNCFESLSGAYAEDRAAIEKSSSPGGPVERTVRPEGKSSHRITAVRSVKVDQRRKG